MARGNQHKPLPPEDDIRDDILFYWKLGLNDNEIVAHLKEHLDESKYGISCRSLKRLRSKWGIEGTRQQKHTFDSIAPFVKEVRDRLPNIGARQIVRFLRQDHSIKVSEKLVADYLRVTEPEAVELRKARRSAVSKDGEPVSESHSHSKARGQDVDQTQKMAASSIPIS